MKFKLFIINILFLTFLLIGNAFSKALPPGSSVGDVPANVLILLDKSGSMSQRMTSGAGVYYPISSAVVSSTGDIYAGQWATSGIKKFEYASSNVDTSFATKGFYGGSGNCESKYPYEMKVHNGYLYVSSFYGNRIFRINLSTAACDWNVSANYPASMDIKNNTLYAFSQNKFVVQNLSSGTPVNISCSWSGSLKSVGRWTYNLGVDSSGRRSGLS